MERENGPSIKHEAAMTRYKGGSMVTPMVTSTGGLAPQPLLAWGHVSGKRSPGWSCWPYKLMPCRKLGLLFLSIYVVSVFGMFLVFAALDHQDVLDFQSASRRLHWGHVPDSPPNQVMCPKANQSSVSYIKVDNRIQVISAFFDTRLEQSDYVRAILVIMGKFGLPKLYCTVQVVNSSDSQFIVQNLTVRASLYEFNENHERRYGGQLLSCPIPKALVLMACVVELTTISKRSPNRTVSVTMSTISTEQSRPKYKFSVCVPPLWGNAKPTQIVEFVEILKLLGIQHVHFYVMQNSNKHTYFPNEKQVRPYLQYYQDQGQATVTKWTLPSHSPVEIWYYGQVLAIHDCLYNYMGESEYVAFNDIDEILVPRVAPNWSGLIDYLESNNNGSHCGYRINMSFFPPMPVVGPVIMNSAFRSSKTTDIRTKCIVRPERIFEMGIHHISKQLKEEWHPLHVSDSVALIHHYRTCDSMFGMKCGIMTEDRTLLQHQQNFSKNYLHVIETVKRQKLQRIKKQVVNS